MDDTGARKEKIDDVEKVVEKYLSDLVTYNNPSWDMMEDVLVAVEKKKYQMI